MLKHHELRGDELHNAKISIEPPTRSPAYIGETVFDGATLWIATGMTASSWTRSIPPPPSSTPPPFFSWSIDLENVTPNQTGVLSLFFSEYSPIFPNSFSWRLLRRYTRGTDLPLGGGILSINSWIEQRGIGLYLPVVSLFGAAQQSRLEIIAANPSTATGIITVARFVESGTSRVYTNARSLLVQTCQASFTGKL